jgi:glycosyltransferase involved in cell wall biosynthesis
MTARHDGGAAGDYLLRVHCEDISPGSSGGIEGFARGMISGFYELRPHLVQVLVGPGQGPAWRESLGGADVEVRELRTALPLPRIAGRLRRTLRRSRQLHRLRAALRQRSAAGGARRVVDYFPYHRARTYGTDRFVTVHDLRVFTEDFKDGVSQRLIQDNIASARAVFTSWSHPRRQILDTFPGVAAKLHQVQFPPMLAAPDGRRRKPGQFLLFPAATVPHKNHRLLVEYLERFPAAPPVLCVGPPVEPGASAVTAAAVRLADERLRFLGMVDADELEDLYMRCLAVVMPSKFEAASGPVMEALARGVPVVASRIDAIESQVEESGAVVAWFDPDDVTSLASAVDDLRRDYDRYTAGAVSGRAWMESLSWPATAGRYLEVIDEHMGV